MDKKTLFVIIITLVLLAVVILLVLTLIGGSTPFIDIFLKRLDAVVEHWFNTSFGR